VGKTAADHWREATSAPLQMQGRPFHVVNRVLDGGVYLSETMSARILKSVSGANTRNEDSPMQKLTDRYITQVDEVLNAKEHEILEV